MNAIKPRKCPRSIVFFAIAFLLVGNNLLEAGRWSPKRKWQGQQKDAILAVAVSPDGKRFAVAGDVIEVRNMSTGHVIETISIPESDGFFAVIFSPDGESIAFSDFHGTIRIWDLAKRAIKKKLKGHTTRVFSIAFSPNGKHLVSGAGEAGPGELKVWDLSGTKAVQALTGHSVIVESICFSPDGKHMASAGGKEVILWNITTRKQLFELSHSKRDLRADKSFFQAVVFSPDGKTLMTANLDVIAFWDVATGRIKKLLRGHTDNVLSIAVSPDGKLVVSGGQDKTVRLWDVATGKILMQSRTRDCGVVNSVAFGSKGRLVISGGSTQVNEAAELLIWDTHRPEH